MARLGEILDAMIVDAQSPDGKIAARLSNRKEFRFAFRDAQDFNRYPSTCELAAQTQALLTKLMDRRKEMQYAAIETATGQKVNDGLHWDANRRAYRNQRDQITAVGSAHEGRVSVATVGLRYWKVKVAPEAFEAYVAVQYCDALRTAMTELRSDHFAQVLKLQKTVVH